MDVLKLRADWLIEPGGNAILGAEASMILADRFHYPEDYLDRCEERLETALGRVPAYRSWRAMDPGRGSAADGPAAGGALSGSGISARAAALDRRYDALPVLDKAQMRASFPRGLMPPERDLEAGLASDEVEYTFTSGTTSEKVINIFDTAWWVRGEAASWKLNSNLAGLSYPQRQAELASSLNVGINCEEDLDMAHRLLGERLYLSEKTNLIQWEPRHYDRMLREINDFMPVILEANPSLLARLSYWALDRGVEMYSPKAIVFTFEFISDIALAAIRRVFSSPFVSSYGSTETGFVMESCEEGLLHQNTDFCRIDFKPLKAELGGMDAAGRPSLGRIYVTNFDNPWNYILRFDVGDIVRLHPEGSCRCGRSAGMIADSVEGRIANLTFDCAGRPVTTKALDRALSAVEGIRDYRLEQRGRSDYMLELMLEPVCQAGGADIAGAGPTESELPLAPEGKRAVEASRAALEAVYGRDARCDVMAARNILPGPAGKFRRTGADFEFDEKELFV